MQKKTVRAAATEIRTERRIGIRARTETGTEIAEMIGTEAENPTEKTGKTPPLTKIDTAHGMRAEKGAIAGMFEVQETEAGTGALAMPGHTAATEALPIRGVTGAVTGIARIMPQGRKYVALER